MGIAQSYRLPCTTSPPFLYPPLLLLQQVREDTTSRPEREQVKEKSVEKGTARLAGKIESYLIRGYRTSLET